MRFNDLIGHHDLAQGLVRSKQAGRLPHALLLLGPEGNGALPLARAFAQFLVCESPTAEDSCGTCPSCQRAAKGIHPDIHYSYPFLGVASGPKSQQKRQAADWGEAWRHALAEQPYQAYEDWMDRQAGILGGSVNKQGNIPVDETHAIQRKLSLKTFEGGYKVLILWLPEYLGNEGNRLLKLIEEPPDKTVFLLVAEDADRILTTILSRTQIVRVPRFPDNTIAQALEQLHGLSAEQAAATATLAEGNYRRAMEAQSANPNESAALYQSWLQATSRWQVLSLFQVLEEFQKLGREKQKHFFRYASHRVRSCWLEALGAGGQVEVTPQEAALLPPAGWERFAADLEKAQLYVLRNANARLVMTNLSIRWSRMMQRSRHLEGLKQTNGG